MSAIEKKRWTTEEYLAFERASEEKHEFIDGEIYAMSGASRKHNLITGNTFAALHAQLRGNPCEIYTGDMRVRMKAQNYTYPDLAVVCDTPKFETNQVDTLLNPTLIVEVLSPSTERYDRGRKFELYRSLPPMQEYVLISQNRVHVERYVRQENNMWLFSELDDPTGVLELSSIGCRLDLAEVYDKVRFDEDSEADEISEN
jgi:Uma2 family endonuclease